MLILSSANLTTASTLTTQTNETPNHQQFPTNSSARGTLRVAIRLPWRLVGTYNGTEVLSHRGVQRRLIELRTQLNWVAQQCQREGRHGQWYDFLRLIGGYLWLWLNYGWLWLIMTYLWLIMADSDLLTADYGWRMADYDWIMADYGWLWLIMADYG